MIEIENYILDEGIIVSIEIIENSKTHPKNWINIIQVKENWKNEIPISFDKNDLEEKKKFLIAKNKLRKLVKENNEKD